MYQVKETHIEYRAFHETEYKALRDEILKRIELQHQIFSILLIAFGGILTARFQAKNAAPILLYPILALFLSFAWVSQTAGIRCAGQYIKSHIEQGHDAWES